MRIHVHNLRPRFLLGIGLLALALAAIGGHSAEQWLLNRLLLSADAPNQEVVHDQFRQTDDPASLLWRFWAAQKIPHRRAVIEFLRTPQDPKLEGQMRRLIFEAALDPDVEVRQVAFIALANRRDPETTALAALQLRDADPVLRRLGLDQLRVFGDSSLISMAAELLDDDDLDVAVSAATTLRRWTGNDFGVRRRLLMSARIQDRSDHHLIDPLPKLEAGLDRWLQWWNLNRSAYPTRLDLAKSPTAPIWILAPSIRVSSLDDGSRNTLRFSGQIQLVVFWASWSPDSMDYLTSLETLDWRAGMKLKVLAICVDPVLHEHAHEEEHAGPQRHQDDPQKPHRATLRSHVEQIVQSRDLKLPVFIDWAGDAVEKCQVTELRTTVLTDPEGHLRRRFVGKRSTPVVQAMIRELLPGHSDVPP